jgi:hypothetical protein
MPRVRFTVRWLMIAVAVVGVILGLLIGIFRLFKMPSTPSEALNYATRILSWERGTNM